MECSEGSVLDSRCTFVTAVIMHIVEKKNIPVCLILLSILQCNCP